MTLCFCHKVRNTIIYKNKQTDDKISTLQQVSNTYPREQQIKVAEAFSAAPNNKVPLHATCSMPCSRKLRAWRRKALMPPAGMAPSGWLPPGLDDIAAAHLTCIKQDKLPLNLCRATHSYE
ncbi:hypothetical protein MRX96_038392 [Rhipicephalus microplus]